MWWTVLQTFFSQTTGELRATGKLDREQVNSYDLVIEAKDKGTPSLKSTVHCKITVTDLNDNKPIFEKSSYDVSIFENNRRVTKILDVRATDADIDVNGKVYFMFPHLKTDIWDCSKQYITLSFLF